MKKYLIHFRFILPVLLIASFLFGNTEKTFAENTGFLSPSANSNIGWVSPENAYTSDNNRAQANSGDDIVQYYNFNFPTIPDGATINGIQIEVEGFTSFTFFTDRQANLSLSWDNGGTYTSGGSGVKETNVPEGSNTSDESITTYGGTSDTWGRTWTPADFTNANFRLKLDTITATNGTQLRIDRVRVKVTYTPSVKTNPEVSVENSPVTYTGTAQSASVVGDVAGVVSDVKYNGSSTTPTNAGTYAVTADFTPADTVNYNSLNDASAGNFVIEKVDANININGFSGPYDGLPHGMTGSATGVLGEDLAGLVLDPSTFTDVSVNTLNWTFIDVTGNYNDTSGTADIEILPLQLTVTATGISKIYDGNTNAEVVLGADEIIEGDVVTFSYGSAFFADAEVGADKNVTVIEIAIGGADAGNYSLANTEAETTANISPIAATITLNGETDVVYDGNPHPLDATTNPEDLDFAILYNGLTDNPVAAGIYNVLAFIIDPEYAGQDTETLTISPLGVTVTVDEGQGKVYGEEDPELTYEITSENQLAEGDELSGNLARTAGEDVGEYDINKGTLGNPNYDITFNGATFTITKASQEITFDEIGDKIIGDPDFDLLATASSGLSVTYSIGEGSTCELTGEDDDRIHILAIGTCTVIAHQAGNGNYNEATDVSRTFKIAELVYTINASAGSNGSISPNGEVTVADGTDQTFTITPNNNFLIDNVFVDEVSVGAVSSYTFSAVAGNHTIEASFKESPGGTSSGSVPNPTGQVLGASTTGQVLGEEKFVFTPTLKQGLPYLRKEDVMELQKYLNAKGYGTLEVDGKFGKLTKAAVIKFQLDHNLKGDGIVGPLTCAELNK